MSRSNVFAEGTASRMERERVPQTFDVASARETVCKYLFQ